MVLVAQFVRFTLHTLDFMHQRGALPLKFHPSLLASPLVINFDPDLGSLALMSELNQTSETKSGLVIF